MPTTAEAGLPEFQTSAWFALFAPKGTPKPILDRLTDALDKALDDDGTRKRMVSARQRHSCQAAARAAGAARRW